MKLANNPLIYLAQKTWRFSAGNRPRVVLYVGLFVLANICVLLQTLIVAAVLNAIQNHGLERDNFPTILGYLGLLVASDVAFWIFHGPARVLENANAFLVRANYKKYLLGGVMHLPVEWHVDHHSGDTIDKIEKGTKALYTYTEGSFMIIEALVRFIGSYIALSIFNFNSLYIAGFTLIFTFWLIMRFDRVLIGQYQQLNRAENGIAAKIFDAISNITTVIILRVEKLVAGSIYKKISEPFKLAVKNSKINETKWFLVTMCQSLMGFLILASYTYRIIELGTAVQIGTMYALYGYVQRLGGLFFSFAWMYSEIVQHKTAVDNAEEVAAAFVNKKSVREIALGKSWQTLDIKNLSFSYHTKKGADLHLDDVSFAVSRGQKIALIGESGSGKTTLLKIIRGLYEPQTYSLFLDGKKLTNGFNAISSEIALIPQDPELFATTIRKNIALGVDRSLNEIKKFTDLACFTTVANRLPKKFESSIVEKGVNLSGGEKQRLALARGLLACVDKSLILLDEPTSSIDYKNELTIYHNIFGQFKNTTIISSIHRLHLLPLFDAIYIFAGGKIVAAGSFTELQTNSSHFQKIWSKYSKTFHHS